MMNVSENFLVSLWLALAIAHSLYPIVFCFSMCSKFTFPAERLVAIYLILFFLTSINHALAQSWKFIVSTYGFW